MTTAAAPLEFRCWNHPQREAAARCPGCRRFFCRECVSEHAGRMLCASCLRNPVPDNQRAGRIAWAPIGRALAAAGGLLVVWVSLQAYGQYLAALPDASHQRVLWREDPFGTVEESP